MAKRGSEQASNEVNQPLLNEDGEELIYFRNLSRFGAPLDAKAMVKAQEEFRLSIIDQADGFGEMFLVCEHMITYANTAAENREIFRRNYYRIRKVLQIDEATGLAKLLLDNIATTWLGLQIIEHENSILATEAVTYKEHKYWDERLTMAQKRFDRAVAGFANAKMKLGSSLFIQINYAGQGGQQVNIANQLADDRDAKSSYPNESSETG